MKRLVLLTCLLLSSVGLAGCGGGPEDASGAVIRQVLVDYRHDEVETSLLDYFPKKVTVRPGDTVEFKQVWTGEPHSVTLGTMVSTVLDPLLPIFDEVAKAGVFPDEDPKEFEAFDILPFAIDEGEGGVVTAQNAAQPCFLAEADVWPGDKETPCPQRKQPAFTGRDAVYSSGLIPYEGIGGNSFKVPIATDAEPGTYSYFCNVHGPLQYGQVTVVADGTDIPSKSEVAKAARVEAERATKVMVANFKAASAGRPVVGGEMEQKEIVTKGKRLIGIPSPFFHEGSLVHGIVNEFIPKTSTVKTGEKVTWTFSGGHTLSFNVPKYFPVFTVAKDGRTEFNPKATVAAGWPGPPEQEDEGEGGAAEPEPVRVDAGTWDGSGFRSTGLDYPEGAEFTVTFTKSGTYPFACLIHPAMVGTLVVK